MSESLLTDRIKALLGRQLMDQAGKVRPVEKSQIERYCEATANMNPLYKDSDQARTGPYGGMIAPPTFFYAPFHIARGTLLPVPFGTDNPEVDELMKLFGTARGLDIGEDIEFFTPIRPGDVLTYKRELTEISEKRIKTGPAIHATATTTITNQRGELVCEEKLHFFFFD
ncbi:MAG: MaoC family dehydratase N-terminal domain-containing protein [Chloroflexi bacterium]|nr:MaoC family dehydratase N-terminal domain-containing protein [Chloroflexota bacterium]